MGQWDTGSKTKPTRDIQATNAIAPGIAKRARSASTVDFSRTCSNGRS